MTSDGRAPIVADFYTNSTGSPAFSAASSSYATNPAGDDHPVFGVKGLRVQPAVGGLRPGDACRLTLGGVEVDATVAVRHAPRTVAFVVPAWNDALLFVEREGMKETHQLGVWLSLYSVPATTAAPLAQGLADLQSALGAPGE